MFKFHHNANMYPDIEVIQLHNKVLLSEKFCIAADPEVIFKLGIP